MILDGLKHGPAFLTMSTSYDPFDGVDMNGRDGDYCDDCDGACDGCCRKGKPLTTMEQQVDLALKVVFSNNEAFIRLFQQRFATQYAQWLAANQEK